MGKEGYSEVRGLAEIEERSDLLEGRVVDIFVEKNNGC
jgi:hypothetical protein